ncbi:DUF6090 family protein [Aquimarina sp. 2201CG5-10]|uniref:DUF6090 family protein n=1 Tax=Aquimarina callyspongiae TaxID=3098150 RepID=UPI002AB34895|nr:DUF6090 family protein [Aquimarina sp. 2201CG5-10]MDY8137925.1 DUF6090 family protein [Aquimarina sp. 2201CG5-10]
MKKINWRYAFGEIIIVILGISIAFWLNSWKENKANSKLKDQYFDNLILDLTEEIKLLEINEKEFLSKIEIAQTVLPVINDINNTRKDTVARAMFSLAQLTNFTPQNTTYQTLVNSGDMKLIDNFELRRSIEEHYSFHSIVLKDYKRLEIINENHLGDFFINNIDYSKMRKGDMEFLEDPILSNIISSMRGAYQLVIAIGRKCIESNNKLLEKIKNEKER